jgi:hypothetical protein
MPPRKQTQTTSFLRLLMYARIGLVLASLLFAAGWYGASKGINEPPVRWIGLVCVTPIAFWYPARTYRRYWHRFTFWLVLAALLTLHVLAFVALLIRIPGWRLLWFVPTTLVESWIVLLVLEAMLHGRGRDRGSHLPESHL